MSIKRRNFTFALTQDNDRIIKIVEKYPKYAYIKHDKDEGREPHYHYYIEFPNPRSLDSVADDLGIPPNMIEKVMNKRGILQYLTHTNQPEKYRYSDDEVITNIPQSDFESVPDIPFDEYLEDFIAYKEGRMSFREFVMKYNMYFTTLSFYSRSMLLSKLYDTGGLSRVGGRSSSQEVVEH